MGMCEEAGKAVAHFMMACDAVVSESDAQLMIDVVAGLTEATSNMRWYAFYKSMGGEISRHCADLTHRTYTESIGNALGAIEDYAIKNARDGEEG